MTKTKKSLVLSALAIVICLSMLIGSTFAWFTDSVSSATNVIRTGVLEVGLEYKNDDVTDWTTVTATSNVFSTTARWEPGRVEVVKLRVSNLGSLALKYMLGVNLVSETDSINVLGENFKLSDYLYYGLVMGDQDFATRADAIRAVEDDAELIKNALSKSSSLEAVANANTEVVTMVVYMPETVGNKANHAESANIPEILLGINLYATQYTSESDSFGNQYDSSAEYPVIGSAYVPENSAFPTSIEADNVTVSIPAGAEKGAYTLEVSDKVVTDNTVALDIELLKDGEEVSGVDYTVSVQIDPMKVIEKVLHDGEEITVYNYNPATGLLTFTTRSFSPFVVTYESIKAEDVEFNEATQIVSGVFEGINPADQLDPTLKDADSEYIAVNYEKDGKTYFVVSKRATTVIAAADNAESYTAINGNYTVTKNQSGKLYSLISGLQNNEFSTVYLLPGTYNEATTIGVFSSMDIIGLGDKEDIEIVRKSGSAQHVFNCNGSKEEYIKVTIQNLYINVEVGATTKNKDVGAVQSIRRSMVKCYDLIVYKNSGYGFNNAAFYVNASNEVTSNSGVYCDAYLYVENTVVNGAATAISTSQKAAKTKYHFNYYNYTYSNGTKTYTQNSGTILNKKMDYNDWEW